MTEIYIQVECAHLHNIEEIVVLELPYRPRQAFLGLLDWAAGHGAGAIDQEDDMLGELRGPRTHEST